MRRRLAQIESSRATREAERADEVTEIRSLIAEAEAEAITMSEVARLLGIDRSTLYRVYINAAA